MHRGSFPYQLTAEDRLIIDKWKWRLGLAYGAILLVLLLVTVANPNRNRNDIAKQSINQGLSSVSIAGENRVR